MNTQNEAAFGSTPRGHGVFLLLETRVSSTREQGVCVCRFSLKNILFSL